MVSSSNNSESGEISVTNTDDGFSSENYTLVGWDMDTTGKKLIDEICQIAGYTEDSQFSQYVMPFNNLSPPARKKHHLKIYTVGRYRMLKDTESNKLLKTKSEIAAIIDFIQWLEKLKKESKKNIILVHHETRSVLTSMLLNSLIQYKLLDRFKNTVKGFINGYTIANVKCANNLKAFSLRTLSRVLFNEEKDLHSAADRALLILKSFEYFTKKESDEKETDSSLNVTSKLITEFIEPMEVLEKEYQIQKLALERQFSLKPIFKPLLQMTRRERQYASPLRRLLAEAGIDYTQLQEAWTAGQLESLKEVVFTKVSAATPKQLADIIQILEGHFDPEKEVKVDINLDTKAGKKQQNNKSTLEVPVEDSGIVPDQVKIATSDVLITISSEE